MTRLAFIPPALPRLRPSPPTGPAWLHEVKFDGWRLQIVKEGASVRLLSRRGHDLSARFPDVVSAAAALGARSVIIDGELTAVGAEGLPDFHALHTRKPLAVCVWCFDLLHYRRDTRSRPLMDRRTALAALLEDAKPTLRLSHEFDDPIALLAEVDKRGLEGIVSKRRASPYISGPRCGWIKVKAPAWRAANRERWRLFERTGR